MAYGIPIYMLSNRALQIIYLYMYLCLYIRYVQHDAVIKLNMRLHDRNWQKSCKL